MCEQLSELKRATSRFAQDLDANLLSTKDAARVLEAASSIEASAQAIKALVVHRAIQSAEWKKLGHRSVAEAVARTTGSSLTAAKELMETGRRLDSQPAVSVAARSGELSFPQVALVANATEADPRAEKRLLETARKSSLSELKDECATTKAASCDLETRRREIHARRYVRSWTDVEGVWHLSAVGNPEAGAQVMAALAPITDTHFKQARREGRRESPDAYCFDALVELSKRSLSRSRSEGAAGTLSANGAPIKLLVRIDYDTFLRGMPTKGEVCELVGYGPVSVSAVKDLVEMGDPFVAAILTKGKKLVGVAHLGRKPTAFQQTALEWMYPSCAAKGCPAQARLERDHRLDWSKTHFMALDHLDLLCSHHHDLKTRDDWALVAGTGKRPFVSPEDPRHPRQRKKRSSAPSTGPPVRQPG